MSNAIPPRQANQPSTIELRSSQEPSAAEPSVENDAGREARWIDRLRRLGGWLAGIAGQSHASKSPAFLVSVIVHCLLLLLLAFFHTQIGTGKDGVLPIFATISETGETAELILTNKNFREGEQAPESTEMTDDSSSPSAELNLGVEPSTSIELTTSSESKPRLEYSPGQQVTAAVNAQVTGGGFRSSSIDTRSGAAKQNAIDTLGGNRESEEAVEAALKWLIAHQDSDGAWRLTHRLADCPADCRNEGVDSDLAPAATGLALLAFLGAGHTHHDGPYKAQLRKAIYYLITRIEEKPFGAGSLLGAADRGMYNHGIATLALCEAYQMTGDGDLKGPCQQLITFTCSAQHDAGGWGYGPNEPGDLTISAWQIMSLKSAKASDLSMPSNVLRDFDRFLDSQQSGEGAYYGYRSPGKEPGTTAMGLLMRMYRGWHQTDPRLLMGMRFLEKTGPSETDIYFDYYATQVFFQQQGTAWPAWNKKMRDFLIRSQASDGHSEGSWYFQDSHAKVGGRLYCTAMAAMTLEVYYRYAPMYQQLKSGEFEL